MDVTANTITRNSVPLRVLMIGTDPRMLEEGSGANRRAHEYATFCEQLSILIVGGKGTSHGSGLALYGTSRLGAFFVGRLILNKQRFNLISVQAPDEVGLIAYLLARLFHLPLQIQVHTDIMSSWYTHFSVKKHVRAWLARFLIPRASCLRVVSQRIETSLRARGLLRSPCVVLPIESLEEPTPGELPTDVRTWLADAKYTLIAVGRLREGEKRFSLLIDVMRELVKSIPHAKLLIVGDGPDRRFYEQRIAQYGLEDSILLTGWQRHVVPFLMASDIFVLSSNYEGWGMAVVEALRAGLPVVMTDVGLAGEVVRDGIEGKVVPVGDAGAFAEACLLLADRTTRATFARAARATGEAFANRTPEEYLRRYRDALRVCLTSV